MDMLKRFIRDERGLETVEYAVIAALIVVGAIVTIGVIGNKIASTFNTLNSKLP
jgi:pilus assembly protein Flp/PilA